VVVLCKARARAQQGLDLAQPEGVDEVGRSAEIVRLGIRGRFGTNERKQPRFDWLLRLLLQLRSGRCFLCGQFSFKFQPVPFLVLPTSFRLGLG